MRNTIHKIITTLTIFIMVIGVLSAQTTEKDILNIRKEYNEIRKNLDSLETKYIDELRWSGEGGDAIAYTKDDQVVMIRATWFGEILKGEYEYYYSECKLIFVFYTDHRYNRPFYYTEKVAKKYGDEAFDPSKTVTSETRYYFKDRVLFCWLNENKEWVDAAEYDMRQNEILSESDELVERFKE